MKRAIKENYLFCILLLICGVYYGYRMFYLVPTYGELYTYLEYTNEGFKYSATNGPLVYNHVLFTMLSSLLNFVGGYVALRGISWLAAMGTLILLYTFLKKAFSLRIAVFGCTVYSMFILIAELAVQGQGYSLGTFFLILAVFSVFNVIRGEVEPNYYKWFGIALWLGMYTLPSGIYWVVPVCISGYVVLLCKARIKDFFKLLVTTVVSAALVILSYAVMWLNLGAMQIAADPTSGYMKKNTFYLILEFPRTCLTRGFKEMVETTELYIIEDLELFVNDFKYLGRIVLKYFTGIESMAIWYVFLVGVILAFAVFVLSMVFKDKIQKYERDSYLFATALCSIGLVALFAFLYWMKVYPIAQELSFFGVILVIMGCAFVALVSGWLQTIPGYAKVKPFMIILNIILILLTGWLFTTDRYRQEYSQTDCYAKDAIENIEMEQYSTYASCDAYVIRQIQFEYVVGKDMKLKEDKATPDILILRKDVEFGSPMCVLTEEEVACFNLERCKLIYENEIYLVYETMMTELEIPEEVPKAAGIPEVMMKH